MSRQRSFFGLTVILSLVLSSFAVSSFMPLTAKFASSRKDSDAVRGYDMRRFRGGSSQDLEAESGAFAQSSVPANPPMPSSAEQISSMSPPPTIQEPVQVTSSESRSLLGPNSTPPGTIRKTFPSLPWHKLPNFLTYLRCMAIPLFVVLFYQPKMHLATSILFALASLTDWFDGFLARRWDISSPFGAFLDPVADKLMVSTSLILLTGRYGIKVALPTAIILAREIAVSALREWMATQNARDSVKVGMQGKVKTALTMTALTLFLAVPADGTGALGKLLKPCELMLYASALITVTSGSVYFRAAAPVLLAPKK